MEERVFAKQLNNVCVLKLSITGHKGAAGALTGLGPAKTRQFVKLKFTSTIKAAKDSVPDPWQRAPGKNYFCVGVTIDQSAALMLSNIPYRKHAAQMKGSR